MDESIRGRIPRCTRGTADSRSEASPPEFGTGDSFICIESCDRLRLAEAGGNFNSPPAPEDDGTTESSEGLSIIAFLLLSGVVRSPMKDVISYCVPSELNLQGRPASAGDIPLSS